MILKNKKTLEQARRKHLIGSLASSLANKIFTDNDRTNGKTVLQPLAMETVIENEEENRAGKLTVQPKGRSMPHDRNSLMRGSVKNSRTTE